VRFTPEQRVVAFWSKVDRRGPDDCWPWKAAVDKDGYGVFGNDRAHRVALSMTLGRPLARGECALHSCDNPACCNNEKHLFLGTKGVNNADRSAKGRSATGDRSGARRHPESLLRGEAHHQAKLTSAGVREIKGLLANGQTQLSIARRFGVSQRTILNISKGRVWRHVS
jgi:hypothetical protein